MTLTMAHLTFGFLALSPIMALPYFAARHRNTLQHHWKGISCVAAFKARAVAGDSAGSMQAGQCRPAT